MNKVTLCDLWPCLKPVTPITSSLSGCFYPRWDGSIALFLSSKTLSPELIWSALSFFPFFKFSVYFQTVLLFSLFCPFFLGHNIPTSSISTSSMIVNLLSAPSCSPLLDLHLVNNKINTDWYIWWWYWTTVSNIEEHGLSDRKKFLNSFQISSHKVKFVVFLS